VISSRLFRRGQDLRFYRVSVCDCDHTSPWLQRKLGDAGECIPIIFITGHGDIPMTVKAIKSGAVKQALRKNDSGAADFAFSIKEQYCGVPIAVNIDRFSPVSQAIPFDTAGSVKSGRLFC
jgi:hypothetical protein